MWKANRLSLWQEISFSCEQLCLRNDENRTLHFMWLVKINAAKIQMGIFAMDSISTNKLHLCISTWLVKRRKLAIDHPLTCLKMTGECLVMRPEARSIRINNGGLECWEWRNDAERQLADFWRLDLLCFNRVTPTGCLLKLGQPPYPEASIHLMDGTFTMSLTIGM